MNTGENIAFANLWQRYDNIQLYNSFMKFITQDSKLTLCLFLFEFLTLTTGETM